jgi:hypothetical protein
MTTPIRIALAAALPMEVANLLFAGGSLHGFPAAASPLHHFLAAEVQFMHLPGAYLLPLVVKTGNPQLAVYLAALVLLVSGYLDWAVLFAAIALGVHSLRKRPAARG